MLGLDHGDLANRPSRQAGKPGGADYRTLLKAVVDADRPDLVAAFDSDDEVEEFDAFEDEVLTDPDEGVRLIPANEVEVINLDPNEEPML